MKPSKNRVFCVDCRRTKMVFDTEKKALLFIKFNSNDIELENGFSPSRAYFCIACGGYHLTSKPDFENFISPTEILLQKRVQENKDIYLTRFQSKDVIEAKKEELKELFQKMHNDIYTIENLLNHGIQCVDLFNTLLFNWNKSKQINVEFRGINRNRTKIEKKIKLIEELFTTSPIII